MPKGTITSDTFEKLAELGTSTAKKTVKSVGQTFSPLKILEQAASTETAVNGQAKTSKEKQNGQNHSALDMETLKKNYDEQDKHKETALRQRLFQLVKEGERDAANNQRKKEEKRQSLELQEEEEKKKKEEEKRAYERQSEAPRGKQRRSIFSPKAKTREKHAEFKPGSGKQ